MKKVQVVPSPRMLWARLTILPDGSRRYTRSGLKVRRLRPGVFRLTSEDGSSLRTGVATVDLFKLLSGDKVSTYVEPRDEEGDDEDGERGADERVATVSRVVINRWYSTICTDRGSILVKVYRIPDMSARSRPRSRKVKLEAGADQRRRTVTADADFLVRMSVSG